MTASFAIGSLVTARGREWVVLPHDDADVLMLRPLGGADADAMGLYLPLERADVQTATFSLPDPATAGDNTSARLLRDAVRLSFRAGAGPFRSLGRIAVEPRPYQLVPLLMALRLAPVRLLIADDVGIGKTIEASLIARELLDRGEIHRLAVICPPHLCDQWQRELATKFHIDAEVVRPGTVPRLERGLGRNESLFDAYPFLVVSVDYIKSDRRRYDFVRACPEFVIVDEAHTCAAGASLTSGQHQRHRLIADLAKNPERHMVFNTATPHSGIESAFRSLLELLDPAFAALPEDETLVANDPLRQKLATHFVQRRRGDILAYLDERTTFPERVSAEPTYQMGADYRRLFDQVHAYATELVHASEGLSRFRQRVCWWAALALLRCVTSSPAAAAATLRTRAGGTGEEAARPASRRARRHLRPSLRPLAGRFRLHPRHLPDRPPPGRGGVRRVPHQAALPGGVRLHRPGDAACAARGRQTRRGRGPRPDPADARPIRRRHPACHPRQARRGTAGANAGSGDAPTRGVDGRPAGIGPPPRPPTDHHLPRDLAAVRGPLWLEDRAAGRLHPRQRTPQSPLPYPEHG